jgi:quercetin dioxygenase-like cupin family protein
MDKQDVYLGGSMPVIGSTEATTFETHGSRFSSYVAPSRGSNELCAWRLDVPADLDGVAHRPNREEILLVLDGELRITLDGVHSELRRGDVALVPANSELCIDAGPRGASAWVTTTPGLEAVMGDGSRITPPWAQ